MKEDTSWFKYQFLTRPEKGSLEDAIRYGMEAQMATTFIPSQQQNSRSGRTHGGGISVNIVNQPQLEKPMSLFKTITTHYVNGCDAAQLSDDRLFELLAKGEVELEKLKAIKTQSKKLAKQIEDIQQQLTDLAAYIDNRKP